MRGKFERLGSQCAGKIEREGIQYAGKFKREGIQLLGSRKRGAPGLFSLELVVSSISFCG